MNWYERPMVPNLVGPAIARANAALGPAARVGIAIAMLREARDHLDEAGAVEAAQRVRAALKSAEGALRHAKHREAAEKSGETMRRRRASAKRQERP